MPGTIILHADDFGMNAATTAGIVRGFERGLLTSTSLLTNAPEALAAVAAFERLTERQAKHGLPSSTARAELCDEPAPFDLGVHLNLTQGRPLTADYPRELLDDSGRFVGIFLLFARLTRRGNRFAGAIRRELDAQISWLADRGWRPTHVNGHQYIETLPHVAPLVGELVERFQIPVVRTPIEPPGLVTTLLIDGRPAAWMLALAKGHFGRRWRGRLTDKRVFSPDWYCGASHAGQISQRVLHRFLVRTAGSRCVEVGLHPAQVVPAQLDRNNNADGWHDPLASQRPREQALLESPELVRLLKSNGRQLGRLSRLKAA